MRKWKILHFSLCQYAEFSHPSFCYLLHSSLLSYLTPRKKSAVLSKSDTHQIDSILLQWQKCRSRSRGLKSCSKRFVCETSKLNYNFSIDQVCIRLAFNSSLHLFFRLLRLLLFPIAQDAAHRSTWTALLREINQALYSLENFVFCSGKVKQRERKRWKKGFLRGEKVWLWVQWAPSHRKINDGTRAFITISRPSVSSNLEDKKSKCKVTNSTRYNWNKVFLQTYTYS